LSAPFSSRMIEINCSVDSTFSVASLIVLPPVVRFSARRRAWTPTAPAWLTLDRTGVGRHHPLRGGTARRCAAPCTPVTIPTGPTRCPSLPPHPAARGRSPPMNRRSPGVLGPTVRRFAPPRGVKLRTPMPGPHHVLRPRLLEALEAARHCPLTV